MQIPKRLLYLGLFVFAGCSTKVELNTEWEDTTIVYGLLDQNEEYHYVKINKAFLGNGDYYAYALIRDSSEYTNVNAYIEESSNGVLIATYPLRDTVLSNRNVNGVFYAPEQTLYYFKHTGLSTARTYKLVAKINEGTTAEKEVTGETNLVQNFSPPSLSSLAVGTYDGSTGTHNFLNQHIKFFPPSNSDDFDIIWRLKWDEYTPTDTVRRTYDWSVGSVDRNSVNASGQVDFEVGGEAFYNTIKNVVTNDPNITRRVFRSVDIIIYAASSDLATYIDINKPQSGLVQERPEFTNVGNGLGLFASRVHVTSMSRPLSLGSYRELVYGVNTSSLLFCSDTTAPAFASPPSVICP